MKFYILEFLEITILWIVIFSIVFGFVYFLQYIDKFLK
jgi:hypothetical protein